MDRDGNYCALRGPRQYVFVDRYVRIKDQQEIRTSTKGDEQGRTLVV